MRRRTDNNDNCSAVWPKVASEAISDHGGAYPHTPLAYTCLRTHMNRLLPPPQFQRYQLTYRFRVKVTLCHTYIKLPQVASHIARSDQVQARPGGQHKSICHFSSKKKKRTNKIHYLFLALTLTLTLTIIPQATSNNLAHSSIQCMYDFYLCT